MHNGLASSNSTPQRTHDAQAQPHAAAPVQQVPHSSPGFFSAQSTPAQQTLQIQPMSGLPRSETAQKPLPEHTHASQNHPCSQPQQIGGTEQWRRTLGFSRRRSSRRFHTEVRFSPPEFKILNSPQIPPSPTHGASPTGCSWSAATSHRVRRLGVRSDRSDPCACEHKRPALVLCRTCYTACTTVGVV